jgi:hypothetical protein
MPSPHRSSRLLPVLLLSALGLGVLPGSVAAADSTGNPGYVSDLVLNSSKSDRYAEYQGSVLLAEGDTVAALKREYRWGGTTCSGYLPTEDQIRYLFEAMRSGRALQIVPSYKAGVAGARCLVALKVRLRPAPL